jgi:FkbM family methyltransferase
LLARRLGARWLLDPRNWIDNRMLAGAPFEPQQLAFAEALISRHQIDTLIDIGANIGLYTVLLGRLPEVSAVHSFEPVARNAAQLHANLFLNRLAGKCTVWRLALGDSDREVTLYIDPRSTGLSRIDLSSSGRDNTVFCEQERVRSARFDDVLDLDRVRAFVKIDVEGHALAVLKGMQGFLAHNWVWLQVELATPEAAAVVSWLRQADYEQIALVGADAFFARGVACQ